MTPPKRWTHPASPSSPSRSLLPLLLLLPLVAGAGAGACKVDQTAFEQRIFACDTTAPDPLCGTDADGYPLTCFAARQIGGSDFCTKACGDTPGPIPADDAVCVQGNAELQFCNPSYDTDGDHPLGACGRKDLGCLRTDVESGAQEGVCITGSPCTNDVDCHDPVRSTCAATFLRQLYSEAKKTDLNADHLYCLQEGCIGGNTACSPGETCLPKVIPAAANPPDICVPNCDSNGRCPPNHFCLSKISGPANPSVCIPGLLGFVCKTDVDCLIGQCKSDNDPTAAQGLLLCTIPCTGDADCARYDSHQGLFVCNNKRCVTPSAYTGALCRTTDDCKARDVGTVCAHEPDGTSTCLRPCQLNADAGVDPSTDLSAFTCEARGGVGHTCLPLGGDDGNPTPVCIPGVFPLPCYDDSQCAVPGLMCVGADPTTTPRTPGNCTSFCTTDADCAMNKWTAGQSYCGGPSAPVCLPLIDEGKPCDAANQCASKVCAVPTASSSMTKTCGGK